MILVTGGTGFVGGHLLKRLFSEKLDTRCLVRKTSNIEKLKKYNFDIAFGDINDKRSLLKALNGVDTVIHLIGIIIETKSATFEKIHVNGTQNLIQACKESGVKRFIYISALGTRKNAKSRYHITKYEAEQIVIDSGIEYVIFRPSIMIGSNGDFVKMISEIVKNAPIVPIIGGKSRVQPIYVENTVDCIISSLTNIETTNRIFEIAGPDEITYKEMYQIFMDVLGVKKMTLDIPIWMMYPVAYIIEHIMSKPILTTQQLIMLKENNICDIEEMLKVFKIKHIHFKEALRISISLEM